MIKSAAYKQEVNTVTLDTEQTIASVAKQNSLEFADDDLIPITSSHNNALVITVDLRNLPEFASVEFETNVCLDEIIGLGNIVRYTINSKTTLVKGKVLKKGAHLDLVGSFKESMRECDDDVVKRGRVFIDCDEALVEAGELVGAFVRGVICKEDVGGKLVELVREVVEGRRVNEEEMITVFKSAGLAVFDLLAHQLVYETFASYGLP